MQEHGSSVGNDYTTILQAACRHRILELRQPLMCPTEVCSLASLYLEYEELPCAAMPLKLPGMCILQLGTVSVLSLHCVCPADM